MCAVCLCGERLGELDGRDGVWGAMAQNKAKDGEEGTSQVGFLLEL